MNEELIEAKKKMREGIVAFVSAAIKATGDVSAAMFMFAKEINDLGDLLTEEDFAKLEESGNGAEK